MGDARPQLTRRGDDDGEEITVERSGTALPAAWARSSKLASGLSRRGTAVSSQCLARRENFSPARWLLRTLVRL